MNWKIIWKKCKEWIFPCTKCASALEDVAEYWFNMHEVSEQEVQRLRSENKILQDKLEEISASYSELTLKYENLLACQKIKFTASNPPAANPDFWDSDWNDMTDNVKKWWNKHFYS